MNSKSTFQLIRLWNESWEAWEIPPLASERPPNLLGEKTARLAASKKKLLSVPTRLVIAAPLWVDSVDAEVVKTFVELELEVRGLLPRKKSSDAVFSRRLTANGKTLVVCAVFPAEVPDSQAKEIFTCYEAAPFLFEPPEDAVALWREGEDIVAIFTRGHEVVYWATLDWPSQSAQIRHWLEMLMLHLESTNILSTRPRRILLDETLQREGFKDLISNVTQEYSSFFPSLKNANFQWKPESAWTKERKSLSVRKSRKLALMLSSLYLFLALAAVGHFGWLYFHAESLEVQIAQLEAETSEFQPTVREWRLIGSSAETEDFPLETLHRIVKNMPRNGVRLTLYDVTEGRVTIEGEAESAPLASQFFDTISKDEDLLRMNWQMPTPSLLPSNAARFQLSGMIP